MDTKQTIIKILNCFETGKPETNYSSIYCWNDGPNNTKQVTLGRGYTEQGTLWDVFEKYKSLGGSNADKLISFKKYKGDQTLPKNKEFLSLIINTAKSDEKFKIAQDEIYEKVYWVRGNNWFKSKGFILPLSLLVIQDSYLQSGSMLKFLINKFSEKVPSEGGNEKKWIQQYCLVRKNWLANHSRKILNNTVYRPEFCLKQIENNNWKLDKFPIYANGIKIT
ncbi:Glycoside hydrolase, family 46 [uncultured Caudovirales phage]|uniref:Glycoside hydrolase, family 46 n=1 Tax=uncultured Caudovirales phage TaxID=2100421 RepID=A0A6J7XBS0_9CAUD|nr:Glycoside hydrolase, family 46 [uncultured Caudovirales phage]